MAMLDACAISASCVARTGDFNVFKDMTGRAKSTGCDQGLASRLQAVSQPPGRPVCSNATAQFRQENQYLELEPDRHPALARDGVEFQGRLAVPMHCEVSRAKFRR